MFRTTHLHYEDDWDCQKCGKKLKINRYKLADMSPIKFCVGCKPTAE